MIFINIFEIGILLNFFSEFFWGGPRTVRLRFHGGWIVRVPLSSEVQGHGALIAHDSFDGLRGSATQNSLRVVGCGEDCIDFQRSTIFVGSPFLDPLIPPVAVLALGETSRAFIPPQMIGCGPFRPTNVCVHNVFAHWHGRFAVSDVLEDRMELFQRHLLGRVGSGRQPTILAKHAKGECGDEFRVCGDEWWTCGRWRQLLVIATQQNMAASENITSWMVFAFNARLLQISVADC